MLKSITICLCLLLIACQNHSKPVSENSVLSDKIPSEFFTFYDNFHSDSIFQINHTIFPLKEKEDGSHWTLEEWTMHKPFDSQQGAFKRQYFDLNGIVIEHITDSNQLYHIERRFTKSGDTYNLIYYKVNNNMNLTGFEPTEG